MKPQDNGLIHPNYGKVAGEIFSLLIVSGIGLCAQSSGCKMSDDPMLDHTMKPYNLYKSARRLGGP
jgi:hypothetical protein